MFKSRSVKYMLNGVSVCLVCDRGARVSLLNKSTGDRLGLSLNSMILALWNRQPVGVLSNYTYTVVKVSKLFTSQLSD